MNNVITLVIYLDFMHLRRVNRSVQSRLYSQTVRREATLIHAYVHCPGDISPATSRGSVTSRIQGAFRSAGLS